MTEYNTKLGLAKITSSRLLINGQWGVMGKLADGRELFISFAGKPDLEAAFPEPGFMSVEAGEVEKGYVVKNGRMFRVYEMNRNDSIK